MAAFEPYGCNPNVENLRYDPKVSVRGSGQVSLRQTLLAHRTQARTPTHSTPEVRAFPSAYQPIVILQRV